MCFQQINNFSCFIEIWIAFFVGLGFKGTSLSMGKIITMSYKMKCTKFRLTHEFTSVTATQLQKSFRWFCLIILFPIPGVVDHDEAEALSFVTQMKNQYPEALSDFYYDYSELDNLHKMILSAHVDFNAAYHPGTRSSTAASTTPLSVLTTLLTTDLSSMQTSESSNTTSSGRIKRSATSPSNDVTNTGSIGDGLQHSAEHDHPIEVDLAHYFHYCSITILAILVVEVNLGIL